MDKKEYHNYMIFVKSVTDIYVGKVTHNYAQPIEEWHTPKWSMNGDDVVFEYNVDKNFNIHYVYDEAPDYYGGVVTRPTNVVQEWLKIENEYATKWLDKQMLTYPEWQNAKDKEARNIPYKNED